MAAISGEAGNILNDQIITQTKFATWLKPVAALALADSVNFHLAAQRLGDALQEGKLRAAAATMNTEGATIHHRIIPKSLWRGWRPQEDVKFWVTGDFFRLIGGGAADDQIRAYGVRFEPMGVSDALQQYMDIEPAPAIKSKGGRRAGTHGEPIARLTKHLLALPPAELAAYKVEALALDLAQEYRASGSSPPHEDNAKRDAAGILRALRQEGET